MTSRSATLVLYRQNPADPRCGAVLTANLQTDKVAKQQYLTLSEEHALSDYVLRTSKRVYPLLIEFSRSLALVIARQRSSALPILAISDDA